MKHICTKFVAMLLVIAMIAGVLPFAFAANVGPFTDVKDTDWFASNVQYVYDNGLMNGTTTTTFEPESNLTRAQTAMVLWRIAGQPAPTAKAPFTDLVDAWYRDAIAWAAEQKVVNGRGDGTFDPAGFITREELVTMTWRYAGEAASEQDLSNWPDADKVYDYAAGAMKWAVETGVINGKDGKLAPKDNATRAQFAAIIERYMKLNDTKADDIVILYTNDVHANITGGSSKAPTLTYEQVAWYRNNLQTPYSLLVDAGDAIQGEAISTLTHGEAIVEVMNAAGYDYATFGNHEFDYGMDQLLDTIVPAAKYQYLTCNFARLDGTAIAGVKPYAIETFGSKKVAVIGISTPESFVKSTPTYFQDKDGNYIYTFAEGNNGQDLYDSVQKTIDAAKKDGADYVVAVAHLGIDESSEPWRSTDVIANTTGLDAVLDGHSHSTIPQEIVKSKDGKDVILSSTGTKLNNLGKLTISADGKLHSELISDREIEKDAKTKEVVDKIVAEFQALLNKVVAHTDVDLTTQNPEGTARAIRNRETNLGDLCADAYRVTLGADIAIVNGGGIRADIPAGDITYNQIIKVHPYGNMACVVEATGQEILDALEMASRNTMAEYVSESVDENGNKVYNAVGEMGGFLQVSGMKYTINTAVESTVKTDDKGSFVSVEGARRVQDVQVLNQTTNTYEPIDPAKTYTLASHNYMLKSGGDGINMFQDNKLLQDEVKIDNQVLIDYIVDSLGGNVGEQYKNLAGEGRITVINETKPALKDNEYALSTELPDGAKVVFVNRSVSKAMSAANSEGSAYNRAGVDVTPVDGILTTDNDEIVWTVEKTEGGFFLKRTDGKKLSIGNKPDGGTYNSMGFDQEDNPVWKIAPAATDGCIYLQSATATGSSGDPKSVEWYAQYSNFSMYYVSSSNEALFAMDMYVNTGAGKPAPAATTEKLVPSTLREGAEIPAYITTPKGYKADGSFPFVVMIHGHGGNHNEFDGFDKISNGLAEQGFVVATLDLPGCGKSKESFQLNTMTNMKADVLDVIDFAGKNGIATKKTNEDKTYEWYYAAETNVPAVVTIEMGEKGGYYDEWLIHQLKRTNNREDYKDLSDAEFANFRNVATTGMGKNALYRSSSPINPEIGRNTYADKAAEAAGVKTFMNLANDEATAKGYEGFDSTYYSKQNVVYLNLGVDFTAADFKTGLATGLRYFTTHEGPYLVHCTEGKDRAGFVSALLECYMGAAYDEIVADYMVTYYNYYGVTKEAEPAKYDAILRSNIVKTLQTAFGVEDLKTADLKQEATDFFKELGLTDAELTTLTANLSKEYTGGSTEPETKSYVKVTAAPEDWSGTYLIVNEADETSAYVFNGNDAVNGYVSATIANSKITSSTELDAVAVTIEKTTDGYTLKVNGQYIYGTDGKNTLKFTDTAANAVNTVTFSETDGVVITSNTSILRFNSASNQMRFRYYKASTYSDQQAIQLYKLEG